MSISLAEVSEVITMIGLVAGGLWAAWSFHKLQRARGAELENRQKLINIQTSQIEQENLRLQRVRQQPQLAIALSVTETPPLADTSTRFLCVTVTLTNEGEQNTNVVFDDSALTVGRAGKSTITDVHRYAPCYFEPHNDKPQAFHERVIKVGQKRQMTLTAPVTEPGLYILQFQAIYFKIPFDDEAKSLKYKVPKDAINAIEQTSYILADKSDASPNAAHKRVNN
jgi:hypothetical protein